MKITSTTRSILLKVTRVKFGVLALAVLFAAGSSAGLVSQVFADKWDGQIAQLRAQADEYQRQANALRAQGDTLQNKLNEITAQVAALQTQIQANEVQRDQLQVKIEDNTKKIADAQDVLGNVLADLYVDDEVSALELLASSKNIGDFVDKQEYRNTIRDQLNSTIANIKKLKVQLETDKASVEKVLNELNSQRNEVAAAQAEQQRLVDETRGEEAAYQNLVASAQSQMSDAAAAQRAYYASLGGGAGSNVVGAFQYWGWSGNKGCGGGYPYCGPQDSMVDPWQLYNRECVSYAAWRISNGYGRYVGGFHGQGNAYEWPSSAPEYSGAYRVYQPQPGDAVVLPISGAFAPIGHLMVVESVSGDDIFVSQFNFYGTGEYSTMHIKPTGVVFLRFPPA